MRRRVMQLVLSLAPGGTERLVIEICQRLADRVDSSVVCLDEPGAWAAEVEAAGVEVTSLGRRPGFQPQLAGRIAQLVKSRSIEVIHAHHYSPYVYGLLASLLTPVRLVFTEHGRLSDAAPSQKRRFVNPLLARLPARICAVSADLKGHMAAEGFPPDRIHVVYNGIELGRSPDALDRYAAREILGIPAHAFLVGTVGRLDPVKNLAVLVQAHALLVSKHPLARLVIIGDGPERNALEALASALGIADAVQFAGYRSDIRRVMPAFDVYANTSAYEGVSLTILEAMAARLPVVATPVGGNPEVVVDAETGLLVPPQQDSIAETIGRLALDAPRRRLMGDAARHRIARHFSIDRMVDAYAEAYRARARSTTSVAPTTAPTPADTMSVTDATRSIV